MVQGREYERYPTEDGYSGNLFNLARRNNGPECFKLGGVSIPLLMTRRGGEYHMAGMSDATPTFPVSHKLFGPSWLTMLVGYQIYS